MLNEENNGRMGRDSKGVGQLQKGFTRGPSMDDNLFCLAQVV